MNEEQYFKLTVDELQELEGVAYHDDKDYDKAAYIAAIRKYKITEKKQMTKIKALRTKLLK